MSTRNPKCPVCGAEESHPTRENSVLIRAYKVHHKGRWWSQCLVCAEYYNSALELNLLKDSSKPLSYENCPAAFDPEKGWFAS